jgi:hypothetical protein
MPIVREAKQVDPGNDEVTPATPEEDPRLSWAVILDAPEVTSFLKKTETPRAKEYRDKVNSVLNTALQFRLGSPNGLADVSAILQRGPAAALRAGALADESKEFRKALDVITAPDNPAVMFALTAIPLVMQILRNHEGEMAQARDARAAKKKLTPDERKAAKQARPRVEFKALGRTWKLPFAFKFKMGNALRMNTVPPDYLVSTVIGDPKIRAELTKRYGVKWGGTPADNGGTS